MSRPRNQAEGPARDNQRPEGVSDDVVAAVGKLNEAVETIERARGHLYAMHQLTGYADEMLDEVVETLARAGHHALATRISDELIGLNVLPVTPLGPTRPTTRLSRRAARVVPGREGRRRLAGARGGGRSLDVAAEGQGLYVSTRRTRRYRGLSVPASADPGRRRSESATGADARAG